MWAGLKRLERELEAIRRLSFEAQTCPAPAATGVAAIVPLFPAGAAIEGLLQIHGSVR